MRTQRNVYSIRTKFKNTFRKNKFGCVYNTIQNKLIIWLKLVEYIGVSSSKHFKIGFYYSVFSGIFIVQWVSCLIQITPFISLFFSFNISKIENSLYLLAQSCASVFNLSVGIELLWQLAIDSI